jgi:hypothetical protein
VKIGEGERKRGREKMMESGWLVRREKEWKNEKGVWVWGHNFIPKPKPTFTHFHFLSTSIFIHTHILTHTLSPD